MPRTQNSSKMSNPYWETERNLTGVRRRPVFWQVCTAVVVAHLECAVRNSGESGREGDLGKGGAPIEDKDGG